MLFFAPLLMSMATAAEPEIDFSGRFQTDLRFRVTEINNSPWYSPTPYQPEVVRNQNIFKGRVEAKSGKFSGVAELDFVMIGTPDLVTGLDALSSRRTLDPFRIEAHAMYIEARDLFVKGLDFRIGQQLVQWGVGDQFNPTNTLNANDVEDPLLFGSSKQT